MADHNSHDSEDRIARQHAATSERQPEQHGATGLDAHYPSTLLDASNIGERGNASTRASMLQSMQHTHGNRAVQRFLQSSSEGLRPIQRHAASSALPVHREEEGEKSWWDEYKGDIGLGNDIVGGVTSTLGTVSDMAYVGMMQQLPILSAARGYGPGISSVGRALGKVDPLVDMSAMGKTVSPFGKAMGGLGTAANVLGIGLGAEKMYNGKGYDVLEGGADATASAIGLSPHPLAKAFSAGYSGGRLLDQGVGWAMDSVSKSDTGEALGMNPGGDYSLSAMLGKGVFAQDQAWSDLLGIGDPSLAYNPETDDPTKVDRSYENTMAYKINEVLDSETVTRAKDDFLADPTGLRRSYKEAGKLAEGAKETYGEASDYASEKLEAAKEYIPNFSLPSIPNVKPPWEW